LGEHDAGRAYGAARLWHCSISFKSVDAKQSWGEASWATDLAGIAEDLEKTIKKFGQVAEHVNLGNRVEH
jgi:hypothetical protein